MTTETDDRAPLLNATNVIGTDGQTMTVTRRDGGTLFADGHPDTLIERKELVPKDALGHALPNGKPCTCSTPTTLRFSELQHCVTCGGSPRA